MRTLLIAMTGLLGSCLAACDGGSSGLGAPGGSTPTLAGAFWIATATGDFFGPDASTTWGTLDALADGTGTVMNDENNCGAISTPPPRSSRTRSTLRRETCS